jgi:hypothetical protein
MQRIPGIRELYRVVVLIRRQREPKRQVPSVTQVNVSCVALVPPDEQAATHWIKLSAQQRKISWEQQWKVLEPATIVDVQRSRAVLLFANVDPDCACIDRRPGTPRGETGENQRCSRDIR